MSQKNKSTIKSEVDSEIINKNYTTGEDAGQRLKDIVDSVPNIVDGLNVADISLHKIGTDAVLFKGGEVKESGTSESVIGSLPSYLETGDSVVITGDHTVNTETTIDGINDFTLRVRGTITLDDLGSPSGSKHIFIIKNCDDIGIYGPGTLDANFQNNNESGTAGDQGPLGLDKCSRVTVNNISLNNGINYGAVVSGQDIHFKNCVFNGTQERSIYFVDSQRCSVKDSYMTGYDTGSGEIGNGKISTTKLKGPCDNIVFEDCVINASNAFYIVSTSDKVGTFKFKNCEVENVTRVHLINDSGGTGLDTAKFIGGSYTSATPDVFMTNQDDVYANNYLVKGVKTEGIFMNTPGDKINCNITLNSTGSPAVRLITDHASLINSEIYKSGDGDIVQVTLEVDDIQVKNNEIITPDNNATIGIRDKGSPSKNREYIGNKISGISGIGIFLANGDTSNLITDVTISHNIIKLNDQTVGGIYISGGYEYVIVTSNNLRQSAGISGVAQGNPVVANNLT